MAKTTAVSSGALATGSTTTLAAGHSALNTINVLTDGTNPATVTVYDNTAASGKVIAVMSVPGASLSSVLSFYPAVRCDIGLTIVVSGTGATGYISYGGL